MSVELEGLEFKIQTKADESAKGVDALKDSLSRLKAVTKGGLGLTTPATQLEKLDTALKKLDISKLETMGRAMQAISNMGSLSISSTVAKQVSSLADAMAKIKLSDVEKLEDTAAALRSLSAVSNVTIPRLTVPAGGVAPATTTPAAGVAPGTTAPVNSSIEQTTSTVQRATGVMGRFKAVMGELNAITGITYPFKMVGQAVSNIVGRLREMYSEFKRTGGIVGLFGRIIGGIFKKSAAGMAAGVKAITSTLRSKLSPATSKATSKMGQFFASIKRIAMYRLIRMALSAITKAFKEGINNLYQYSNLMGGTFAQSMNSMATSAQYLKNSFGAMAAPLINALAPAIDFVADKIASLLNMINMLIARLSGSSTYTAAKKLETAYGGAASGAAGAVKDAADKIKQYTSGIDELNIFQKQDDEASGGGGGGGVDYGSMFEEAAIDSNIGGFADQIKQAFEASDWTGLGTLLGEKINGIIDSIDFANIGSQIGSCLNGAIQTTYSLMSTIDFKSIGTRLAELLNSAISKVDASTIGKGIIKWFTLQIDVIIGGLGGLDWAQIGKKLSDFILGACDEVTNWLKSYDWKTMGTNLWNNIKAALTSVDWAGIAKSVATALGTALGALVQLLGPMCTDVWTSIKTFFSTKIEECGGSVIQGLWKGISDAFSSAWNWIKTNLIDPFVKAFKDLLGIKSPSTVMKEIGGYVVDGFLNGILAPFKAIGTWVKEKIITPLKNAFSKEKLAEFSVGVKNTATTWWSNVKSWWAEKVSSVKSFTTGVANKAATWWSNVKGWWEGKVSTVKSFSTSVKNGATTWWTNVKDWWAGKVSSVKSFSTSVKNGATTWWSNVKSWWNGKVGEGDPFCTAVTNAATTWWTNVKTWWSGKVGTAASFKTAVTNGAKTWWENTKSWWSGEISTAEYFKTGVVNASTTWWSCVQTWWNGKVSSVKNFTTGVANVASTWWSNVKTWWSGKVGMVKEFSTNVANGASTWWSNTKSWWSGEISTAEYFKTGVVNAASTWWANVKTWWNGTVGTLSIGATIENNASTWWTNVKDWWKKAAGDLTTSLKISLPTISINWSTVNVLGKDFKYPTGFNVVWNAKGGILDGAQIFGAMGDSLLGGGEAGREAVLPLDTHTEWMDTLAQKVRDGMPSEGGYGEFRRALEDFYSEYVQPTMNQMAADMQRQANKKEQTNVQIGNRAITDAVTTQQNANGYRFAK